MRKLKLQVQMTLDGFVAGTNGELDWMWIGKRDEAILSEEISSIAKQIRSHYE